MFDLKSEKKSNLNKSVEHLRIENEKWKNKKKKKK